MGIVKKFVHGCCIALETLAVVLSSVNPVMAANIPVYGDYDSQRVGSITLYKYVSNDGKSIESTGTPLGTTTDEQLSGIQNATGNYKMIPEKGVKFKYHRIGVYEQINNEKSSGMYVTNLESDFLNLLNQYGITLTPSKYTTDEDDGKTADKKHYDSDKITAAMEKLEKSTNDSATGEEATRTYVNAHGTDFESKTNSYGKTTATNLPTGLYLVAEVDWEHQSLSKSDDHAYWERNEDGTEDRGDGSNYADIVSPSSPFLVQLPIQNVVEMTSGGKTYQPGEGYIYDVTAYPKNGTLTVHKDIIVDNHTNEHTHNNGYDTDDVETMCDYAQENYLNSNTNGEYYPGADDDTNLDADNTYSTLTHQIDVNIGDTVYQVISSDVPALIGDKLNKTYKISDIMLEGLSFVKVDEVRLGTGTWDDKNNGLLAEGQDYVLSVSDDKKTFTVELTQKGLQKLDAVSSASYIYVIFESNMNTDALIGTNVAGDDGHVNQNTAKLTYATDRTAEHDYYSNTCRVYTYELDLTKTATRSAKKDFENVAFKVEGSFRDTTNGINNDINAQDKNYKTLSFVKVGDGEYKVYDPISNAGQDVTEEVSPNANGLLKLYGADARDYKITETKTSAGNSLNAEPFYVRIEANMAGDRKYENGSVSHAYVWTGNEPLKLAKYDIANGNEAASLLNGVVKISVLNNSGIKILPTGGFGNRAFKIAGASVILCGLLIYAKKRRDKKEENANA